ncbi:MAG: alpha/beta hydrolase [Porphyrobacter sp. IPPAS B-1204]|nr:MAG: alpha/beta hydrolase [Porphyrobacter sp. IPPAS B-1204]
MTAGIPNQSETSGQTVLYFHGLPGSAAELASFGAAIAANARHFHVVARGDALAGGEPSGYFGRLAAQIERQWPDEPLHLVGFSLGAAAALRVAPVLGARARQIDLVAPAAPLSLGDFLDDMAGAPVFRAARAGRATFAALTQLQALAARFAMPRMAAALMASARGGDAGLAADPLFLEQLAHSLRASLLTQRAAYQAELRLYVADWSADLAKLQQPVTIWQGSEDNWTPPAMAQALAAALPAAAELRMQPGLSHFSTLRRYLETAIQP